MTIDQLCLLQEFLGEGTRPEGVEPFYLGPYTYDAIAAAVEILGWLPSSEDGVLLLPEVQS